MPGRAKPTSAGGRCHGGGGDQCQRLTPIKYLVPDPIAVFLKQNERLEQIATAHHHHLHEALGGLSLADRDLPRRQLCPEVLKRHPRARPVRL